MEHFFPHFVIHTKASINHGHRPSVGPDCRACNLVLSSSHMIKIESNYHSNISFGIKCFGTIIALTVVRNAALNSFKIKPQNEILSCICGRLFPPASVIGLLR